MEEVLTTDEGDISGCAIALAKSAVMLDLMDQGCSEKRKWFDALSTEDLRRFRIGRAYAIGLDSVARLSSSDVDPYRAWRIVSDLGRQDARGMLTPSVRESFLRIGIDAGQFAEEVEGMRRAVTASRPWLESELAACNLAAEAGVLAALHVIERVRKMEGGEGNVGHES